MVLGDAAYFLQFLIKMADASINDLLLEDSPKSDLKWQKLIECVLTGNSKQYLSKAYTEEQINKLSAKEVDKLFSNYEAKLSGQMVKFLGKSIIKMYSMGTYVVLRMANQDASSDDQESDPFLKFHSSKVNVRTVSPIWFVSPTSKRRTDYEQTLLVRTWY